jgi:diguanylate cyclase (GGDEF)-like protein
VCESTENPPRPDLDDRQPAGELLGPAGPDPVTAGLSESEALDRWALQRYLAAAAQDRAAAAHERQEAADDRQQAAVDRQRAADYLQRVYRDELTGTLSRHAGRDQLVREIARAQRSHTSLTIAFLDVDNLKRVNDESGHADGDALLRAVGQALIQGLRVYDVIVRYGGDEFICALPGASAEDAGLRFTAVRELLTASRPNDTLSMGLVELQPEETLDEVIHRADLALYNARR